MNPVHSSLLPFFAVLAHFHAMMKPPKRETPPLYPRAPVSQRNCASALSNEEPERTGSVRRASGETPGVLSGERLSRRERPAARNACEAERRLRRAAPVRDRRSTFLPQSTPESPAQVLTAASSSPR